jgi:DNA-binding CsgD family transcriptional regulator
VTARPSNVLGQVIGRDHETATIRDLLVGEDGARALVLAGLPGIGKTTLFEAAIDVAHEQGFRVLLARANDSAVPAPFEVLIDLCDRIDSADLANLPAPQREALAVALVRARPGSSPPSPREIALGFLGAVRGVSAREPVLVAIDDAQWVDPSSREVLAFLAHRLREENVCVILTRSTERPTGIEAAFEHSRLRRMDLGPLSFGAVRKMLLDRLGLSLSRALLHRIVDITEANPLFVLELGRELAARGVPEHADELPIPAQIEDLLAGRIAALSSTAQRALMALALCPTVGTDGLIAVAGEVAFDEVVDRELVWADGQRVRASHPLLGATALRRAGQGARRELHRALAAAIGDPEQRAMHLALATPGSDEALSANVADAAERAAARGARQQAVALAEHAVRLTPTNSAERSARVLQLAGYLETAGEMRRLTDFLAPEIESLPAGGPRAWALLILSEGAGVRNMDDLAEFRRRALAEDPDNPLLRARVLAKQACNGAATRITGIPQAEAWASEAVNLTSAAPLEVHRPSLYALAWARAMSGRSVDDLCRSSRAMADVNSYIAVTPERVAGQRYVWRGEIPQARSTLRELLALAEDHGEIESYALVRLHICELHLRVGEWAAAEALLGEWAESTDRELMFRPKFERCRALLAAGQGDLAATREWSALAITRSRETGSRWDEIEGLRASAMGSLLAHEPEAAAKTLLPAWNSLLAEGVAEPGVFPLAPELVQALVESDDLAQATVVTNGLAEVASQSEHPWASATVSRCHGMIALAESDEGLGPPDLTEASAAYESLGLRFDAARCLLSLGRAQRRRRQWGSARSTTERAIGAFDAIGSFGWSADARGELGRMGARRPTADGHLTAAEERAAQLAAAGLSNKEIARELAVGVHTVEVHLSRVYAKLGVRSRGQLAARLHGSERSNR